MVIDPRPQIKAELERELAKLRVKLDDTKDDDARKAIKREMRQLKSNARRLRRTAVF